MILRPVVLCASVLALTLGASMSVAQLPNTYGAPIDLETAKKAAAPAIAEARKNNWRIAVAIVDTGGQLVYFEKLDGTQTGSVDIAIGKARTSALFKRPTKAFQDAVAGGGEGLRILGVQEVMPLEGGLPLLLNNRVVGAIGVSGVTSQQDAQCAQAGADALLR
jgi:uncharacterized protein GlcG (DUF336 family)